MAQMTAHQIMQCELATERAKRILKPGDRIRASRCGGKSTYIFDGWEGRWIVSRTGIDDISAIHIDRLNGEPVNFLQIDSEKVAES